MVSSRMMSKIEFLALARQRKEEAQALVADLPAEETGLTTQECLSMAMELTQRTELALRFAVFEALCERFMR